MVFYGYTPHFVSPAGEFLPRLENSALGQRQSSLRRSSTFLSLRATPAPAGAWWVLQWELESHYLRCAPLPAYDKIARSRPLDRVVSRYEVGWRGQEVAHCVTLSAMATAAKDAQTSHSPFCLSSRLHRRWVQHSNTACLGGMHLDFILSLAFAQQRGNAVMLRQASARRLRNRAGGRHATGARASGLSSAARCYV